MSDSWSNLYLMPKKYSTNDEVTISKRIDFSSLAGLAETMYYRATMLIKSQSNVSIGKPVCQQLFEASLTPHVLANIIFDGDVAEMLGVITGKKIHNFEQYDVFPTSYKEVCTIGDYVIVSDAYGIFDHSKHPDMSYHTGCDGWCESFYKTIKDYSLPVEFTLEDVSDYDNEEQAKMYKAAFALLKLIQESEPTQITLDLPRHLIVPKLIAALEQT